MFVLLYVIYVLTFYFAIGGVASNKNDKSNPQNDKNKDKNTCMFIIIQLKYTLSNN